MPYKDPAKRREYDREYKRKQRLDGWTKKALGNRLTASDVDTTNHLRDVVYEVIAETRSHPSLDVEKKLKIRLKAVEIGLRVIEITDHERRIAALEQHDNGAPRQN